ncbi:cyclic nucleotide-binding domain-containing protein [Leptobacterium flavescens]|uniref:Cyclic nucleotide-binding domain-containing protein n=1 Tax=Leptobacterium flavescens TaxID=472055 RepID=A0A6P0UQU3_9FLAO|nr:Crp/Fnr family transcriptional regulator [Leptobacterium flavescens]NER14860.1 cyclic nucleotide-binding domain-containing protein [Leptobacterium flavescens]
MKEEVFFDYLSGFVTLSNDEKEIFRSKITSRRYLKGQYLLQQGDHCNHMDFLLSGSTRTFHVDEEGKEHVFRFAIENWWATDVPAFLEQKVSATNIQCLENTEVIRLDFYRLEELYLEIPKTERLFRILFQKVAVSLEKRIIDNLSLSAKERFLIFREEYPQFEQRIPQYMIASYLGITKQYLSEIRSQLARS